MEDNKSVYRWLILAMLFLMSGMSFCSINAMPPLFLEIQQQIPLTKAQMGLIMGSVLLSSLLFAPLGGGISDKIGSRWAATLGILLTAAAGALRWSMDSATGLIACNFFLGAGVALFSTNIPKALGMWFPRNELALANGVCSAGLAIGGVIGMGSSASFLSPTFGGWRGAMLLLGGCLFLTGVFWMLFYRDPKNTAPLAKIDRSMRKNFKKVIKVRDLNLILTYRALIMFGWMGLITFLPRIFQERGLERAGEMVSIMMGAVMVFNIVGASLSDRLGKRKPFLIASPLILGLAVLTFQYLSGIPLIIALAIAGAGLGTISPLFFVLPVEFEEIGPKLAATAAGIMLMIGNTFGFLGPFLTGKVIDMTGSNATAFVLIVSLMFLSVFLVLPIRETGRKKEKQTNPVS
jgi:cyanate permease